MNRFYFYSIHDIIRIRTNVEIPVPDYFKVKDEYEPDIEIIQEDLNFDVPKKKKKKRKDYSVWKEDSALLIDYETPVLSTKLMIEDLQTKPKIRFTRTYLKHFKKHVFTLINLILQLKLIQKGYTLVHSSCVSFEDYCALIPALGSTGKTFTVLSLLDGKKFKFMSDDLTILSREGEAFSYPGKIGTGPYVLKNESIPFLSVNPKISSKLAKFSIISIIFGKFPWLYKSKNLEMPKELITDKAKVKYLFLITSGEENKATKIDKEEAISKVLIEHIDTHNLFGNYALNYYSFLCNFDLCTQLEEMRNILRRGLKGVECYELRSNNLYKYPEMIKEVLRR